MAELSTVVADMVRVQLLIGCRPGEICRLTPSMIDRTGEVWIAALPDHKTAYLDHDRYLYIGPLAQRVLAPYLRRDPDECLFRPCDAVQQRREQDAANRTTPLSCGNRHGRKYDRGGLKGDRAKKKPGNQYTVNSYRRAIHSACDRAFPPPGPLAQRPGETAKSRDNRLSMSQLDELKEWESEHRWSPNRLRHTRATEIRKEFGLEAAQVILGHSAADVTQVYAERDAAKAIEVARKTG